MSSSRQAPFATTRIVSGPGSKQVRERERERERERKREKEREKREKERKREREKERERERSVGTFFDRQAAHRPPRGKQKGSAQGETLAVFTTTRVSEEQVPVLPFPSQNRGRQIGGIDSSKGRPSRGSPSGRVFRRPCKDYLKGTCTNPLCD